MKDYELSYITSYLEDKLEHDYIGVGYPEIISHHTPTYFTG